MLRRALSALLIAGTLGILPHLSEAAGYQFIDANREVLPDVTPETIGRGYSLIVGLHFANGRAWFYEPAMLMAAGGWGSAAFVEVDLSALSQAQRDDLKNECPGRLPCLAEWHITLLRQYRGLGLTPPADGKEHSAFELTHNVVRLDGWNPP